MPNEEESFDLTTPDGMQRAIELLKANGMMAGMLGTGALIPVIGPVAVLGRLTYDYFKDQPDSLTQQSELISRILRAGKENGASEIEVIVDDDIGIDIGAKLPPNLGDIDVRFKVGGNSKIVIRAKYRDA